MQIMRRLVTGLCAALFLISGAWAQERGTKAEAKAMVDAAYEHIKKVGLEKACDEFTHDKANWTKKDLYLMVYDAKGVGLAHGFNEKIVGKDMTGLKDASGKAIVPGLLAVAAKGGGWYDYDWPDPVTKKLAPKSTYARTLPTGDGLIGVGVYR